EGTVDLSPPLARALRPEARRRSAPAESAGPAPYERDHEPDDPIGAEPLLERSDLVVVGSKLRDHVDRELRLVLEASRRVAGHLARDDRRLRSGSGAVAVQDVVVVLRARGTDCGI